VDARECGVGIPRLGGVFDLGTILIYAKDQFQMSRSLSGRAMHEHPPVRGTSASCYSRLEDVGIPSIVEAPLKFVEIHRQLFLRNVVIGADGATLQDSKTIRCCWYEPAAYPFLTQIVHCFMRTSNQLVVRIFISRNVDLIRGINW
jgi:hypothetical protein